MSQPIPVTSIRELSQHVDEEVELRGWIDNKRSSGKIAFLQVRMAGGSVQAVAGRTQDYPITPKEHGTAFLMEHRHRKYGSFPHSGFGMGIERFVAWMTGLTYLRETIPYPRMLYKIYP